MSSRSVAAGLLTCILERTRSAFSGIPQWLISSRTGSDTHSGGTVHDFHMLLYSPSAVTVRSGERHCALLHMKFYQFIIKSCGIKSRYIIFSHRRPEAFPERPQNAEKKEAPEGAPLRDRSQLHVPYSATDAAAEAASALLPNCGSSLPEFDANISSMLIGSL